MIFKVSKAVSQAIQRYYAFNTHPGCTDPSSTNYNYQANTKDQSCEGSETNLSLEKPADRGSELQAAIQPDLTEER
ncbi:macrophage-expressed protein 1-like [Arapaima gigas]